MELKDIMPIAAAILALLMAGAGLVIMFRQIMAKGLGAYSLQGLGLVMLVPTILMLALIDAVRPEVVATLLGGVAGYIFGRGDEKS
jgi:hypothetical protein